MEHTILYPAPHNDLTVFPFFYIDNMEFSCLKGSPLHQVDQPEWYVPVGCPSSYGGLVRAR